MLCGKIGGKSSEEDKDYHDYTDRLSAFTTKTQVSSKRFIQLDKDRTEWKAMFFDACKRHDKLKRTFLYGSHIFSSLKLIQNMPVILLHFIIVQTIEVYS